MKLRTTLVTHLGVLLSLYAINAAAVNIPANFGVYTIEESGTYIINGTVTGQYIDIKGTATDVVIRGQAGTNPTFQGQPYTGARSASHIRGGASNTTLIEDFTFIGKVGHNFMSLSGDSSKTIRNLTVINDTKDGAGAINPGPNSLVTNCTINPHDDAIKITEPNSRAQTNTVTMDGNGAVIQLGWGLRADGAIHYAFDTVVRGYLKNNSQTNTNSNPGRAIIGGIFENDTSDVQITGLDIDMTNEHSGHYIKLKADGATLSDVVISGVIHNDVSVAPTIDPVALSTANGGSIQNITIDFGNKIGPGDVYSDAGVTGLTIGGGSGGNPPTPPSNLVLTPTCDEVALSWTDNADNEDSYDVRRKVVGGSASTVTTLPANSQSYTDTTVAASTNYEYKVRAHNANGVGATAWTAVSTSSCSVPVDITVTSTKTDCNASGSSRNIVYFDLSGGSYDDVSANRGVLTEMSAGSYRIREIGAPFGSQIDYVITVKLGSEVVGSHTETLTTVGSCP